jgi:drug/metabolite transporter (DMT)-like permease
MVLGPAPEISGVGRPLLAAQRSAPDFACPSSGLRWPPAHRLPARRTVTHPTPPHAGSRLALIGPALLAASSFAGADVLSKIVFNDGAGVLTISTARGVLGLAVMFAWLQLVHRPAPMSPRARWISLGVGVLFAGNVFLLFMAIEAVEVPIAILTYFIYPLLTGLAAAATGLEKLSWRGAGAAIAAFLGLALMISAHPSGLAITGILAALGAAGCRVAMLLVTRAKLQGADPLLITWHSLVASTVLLVLASLATFNWQPPATTFGWFTLTLLSVAVTTGILGVFASTGRIGPFRTALFMNLEPLLATIGSALFLDEVITPLQALGGAVMIAALVAFQLRR